MTKIDMIEGAKRLNEEVKQGNIDGAYLTALDNAALRYITLVGTEVRKKLQTYSYMKITGKTVLELMDEETHAWKIFININGVRYDLCFRECSADFVEDNPTTVFILSLRRSIYKNIRIALLFPPEPVSFPQNLQETARFYTPNPNKLSK